MEENSIQSNRSVNASLNPYAVGGGGNSNQLSNVNYNTGYADIDNLTKQSNQLMQNSLNAQNQAIQTGVETNVNEINRQKGLAEQENTRYNKGLYQNYVKQMNPYGENAEAMAAQGLGHSGVSETTKTNIYSTYQKNLTESLNNLANVKASYDAQIAQVRSQGDIAQAQNLSNMYLQQIEQIRNAYTMAQAQKEFEWQKAVSDRDYNYQLGRDKISDERYANEWAYQQGRDKISDERYANEWAYQQARDRISDQRYANELAYQKERDRISDNQWQQQFNASQASRSSGGSSGRSSSGRSYSSGGNNYGYDDSLVIQGNNKDLSLRQIAQNTASGISNIASLFRKK